MKLIFVILLLLMNAFFVAAEFALVRVRVSQLEGLKNDGVKSADQVLKILEKIDSYLSAVQLGVTMASLGLGWLIEPAINHYLTSFFAWINSTVVTLPLSTDAIDGISAAIAFTLASFLHIVIGEITPKSIAIAKPLEVSMFVARPMRIFHTVFNPVMALLVWASNALLKLLRVQPVSGDHSAGVTAEELRIIAQHSQNDGTISKQQGDLLENVFNFTELNAKEIMIPRGNIIAMPSDASLEGFLVSALKSGHSRYPIYNNNIDDIIGVVHIKDVVAALHKVKPDFVTSGEFIATNNKNSSAEHKSINNVEHKSTADLKALPTLKSLARKVVNIPETATITNVLETLKSKRAHIAVVVDEYGGTSGILTIEDAIERLVGNIEDEFDPEPQENIVKTDDGWIVNGITLLSEFCEVLEINEIECESDTVAGFIMEKLENIAKEGELIQYENLRLRVDKMDKLRIDKVFVEIVDQDAQPSN